MSTCQRASAWPSRRTCARPVVWYRHDIRALQTICLLGSHSTATYSKSISQQHQSVVFPSTAAGQIRGGKQLQMGCFGVQHSPQLGRNARSARCLSHNMAKSPGLWQNMSLSSSPSHPYLPLLLLGETFVLLSHHFVLPRLALPSKHLLKSLHRGCLLA